MISLLLTLFISLFSFCPPVYTIGDHEENTIIYNDSIPIKNFGYIEDEFNKEAYVFLSDLVSTDFIKNFIEYCGEQNAAVRYDNTYISSYTFNKDLNNPYYGINTVIKKVVTAGIVDSYYSVYSITLSKESINDDVAEVIRSSYRLSFNDEDNSPYMYITYDILYKLFRVDTQEDVGFGVIGFSSVIGGRLSSLGNFCFYENTSNSIISPLINGYISRLDSDYYWEMGYNNGFYNGRLEGYQTGYSDGYSQGSSIDDTASTIFTGILDVALIPVNVFLTIFNFDVFGINIAGIVSALLTISVVVIIIRFVTGKKDD